MRCSHPDNELRNLSHAICRKQIRDSSSIQMKGERGKGQGKSHPYDSSAFTYFFFSFGWAHPRTEITNIYSRLCTDSFIPTRVNTSILRSHAMCDLDMRSCKILYQIVNLDALFLCYLIIDRVSSADLTSISSWDGCQISQLYYYPMACSQKLFNNYDNFRESCLCVTVHISS